MIGVLAIYSSLLSIAYWLAFELRFEFLVPGAGEVAEDTNWQEIRLGILPWLVLTKLCILLVLGEFRNPAFFPFTRPHPYIYCARSCGSWTCLTLVF